MKKTFFIPSLIIFFFSNYGLAQHSPQPIQQKSVNIIEDYIKEAQNLLSEGKIKDASMKYYLAAQEYSKIPNKQREYKSNMAHFHFYTGWSIYTEMDMSGVLKDNYLKESLEGFKKAANLYSEVGNDFGSKAAEGWTFYISGISKDFQEEYEAARKSYEEAWKLFRELVKMKPEASETLDTFISIAERGVAWSMAMQFMSNIEEMGEKGGEITQALESAKKKSSAKYIPYWDGITLFLMAQISFWDGVNLLERWDCSEAQKKFDETSDKLNKSKEEFSKLPFNKEKQITMVDVYQYLNEAEKHHVEAMLYLLEKGNPGKAKDEFIHVADNFRIAQGKSENAGMSSQMIGSIRDLYDKIRQRALVVSNTYSIKNVTIDAGWWFVLFFFVTFFITTLLKSHLGISGSLIIWISLIVGILGGFGLKSPEILTALKGFKQF